MNYSNRMMNSGVSQPQEKCSICGALSGHPLPSGDKCDCGEPFYYATQLQLHYGEQSNVDYCAKCRTFRPHVEAKAASADPLPKSDSAE